MKFEIFNFESISSTNDTAIDLIKNKKKIAGCICAKNQTKGRGTHGNKWISIKGNLFMSLFFPLKNQYPSFTEFSIINPVIISEVLKKFIKKKQNVSIKFPNDLFLNGKKISGILQEVITSKSKKYLIIGVGLNIEANPKKITRYEATNIFLETNKKPKIAEILNSIIFSYESFFNNLNSYNYLYFKKKADLMALDK
tara:strand:- start:584 stop:1174 length:591 start_codon:yes stop_codon:yes gene_type:complete